MNKGKKVRKRMKLIVVILLIVVGMIILLGPVGNIIFTRIMHSFYITTKPYDKADATIHKIHYGDGLTGYISNNDNSNRMPLIIYFGGSGEIAYNAVFDYHRSFSNYIFASGDYPGTQESEGSMNKESMLQSTLDLYDYLAAQQYVDRDNIYIIGYSYGTGMATYLASERSCQKLILIAPYRNTFDMYNKMVPVYYGLMRLFVSENFNTAAYAASVGAKTLIITSDGDEQLKSSISYSLVEKFGDASVMKFPNIKHPDYWKDNGVVNTIREWLAK